MKNTRKGFTLVELVIVIAVIAILAAVLIPTFTFVLDNAKQAKVLNNLKTSIDEAYIEYITTVNETPGYLYKKDGVYSFSTLGEGSTKYTLVKEKCVELESTIKVYLLWNENSYQVVSYSDIPTGYTAADSTTV